MSNPRRRQHSERSDEIDLFAEEGEPLRERGLPAAEEEQIPSQASSPPIPARAVSIAQTAPGDDFESFLESLNEEEDEDLALTVAAPLREGKQLAPAAYTPPHALVSPVSDNDDAEEFVRPRAFVLPKHPGETSLEDALDSLGDDEEEGETAHELPEPSPAATAPPLSTPRPLSSIYDELLDDDEPVARPRPMPVSSSEPLPDIAFEEADSVAAGDIGESEQLEEALPDLSFADGQPAATESKEPTFHTAVRRAVFSRHSALSVMSSPSLVDDFDELSHVLSAFVGLRPGFRGFVRVSLRDAPSFKADSAAWTQSIKMGVDPATVEKSGWKKLAEWLHFSSKLLWYHANKDSKTFGGSAPPLKPGQAQGQAKPIPASQMDEESKQALNDARKKIQDSVHYDVSLRVGVIGPPSEQPELERLADEASNGFSAFNTPYQDIVFVPDSDIEAVRGYMPPEQSGQLVLSAAETGVMFKVPDATMQVDGLQIKYSDFKQITPPNPVILENMSRTYLEYGDLHLGNQDAVNQLGKLLGGCEPEPGLIPLGVINKASEDARVIGMRVNEMDQHIFYCGRTGSGKSEMMKWLIWGSAKAGYPIVLIDPHGALSDDVVNGLILNCPERVKDIVLCDLSSPDFPVGFNPLDVKNHEQIEGTVGAVLSMLERQMNFAKSSAPRATNYAYLALTALCEANLHLDDPEAKCTLLHVTQFFLDQKFRQLIVSFCDNVAVQEMFNPDNGPYEMKKLNQQQEEIGPILRCFQELSRSGAFSAVFSSPSNKLDFGKLIMQNKIILIKLARFHTQQKLGEFIGSLVLPYLLNSMGEWGRTKDPDTGELVGRGCRCFVDEAPRLLGPESPVEQILAEARKWDMSLTFASQYLDQFDQSVVKAALANTATKLALVLDPASARLISQSLNSNLVTANDIAALPRFHYYGNVLLPGGHASGAFSAACMPPLACSLTADDLEAKEEREKVIKRSRMIIANDMDEIERIRRKSVEAIGTALTVLHSEKIASGVIGADDDLPGGYAVDLDLDDDTIF